MSVLLQLLVGAVVGVLVGITGTGGAFVIPALMYLFRRDPLRAQGTALLVSSLPIWFIAFIPYGRAQHFDLRLALLIAAGICVGSYFGASWAQHLSLPVLRRGPGSGAGVDRGAISVSGMKSVRDLFVALTRNLNL